jgi:hypothetical protein
MRYVEFYVKFIIFNQRLFCCIIFVVNFIYRYYFYIYGLLIYTIQCVYHVNLLLIFHIHYYCLNIFIIKFHDFFLIS